MAIGKAITPNSTVRYTPILPVHIFSATLDTYFDARGPGEVQMWMKHGNKLHLFGVVSKASPHINLKLTLYVGDEYELVTKGEGTVYLSGNTDD